MISVRCVCGGEFWLRDRLAGRPAICPSCRATLTAPPMEAVRDAMTPATCACGEVFWSSNWKPGKMSRCPVCGAAVSPPKTESWPHDTLTASAGKPRVDLRPSTTPPSRDRPPSSGEIDEAAPSSSIRASVERKSLAGRKNAPLTFLLALGTLSLLAVSVVIGTRTMGPTSQPQDENFRPGARNDSKIGALGVRDKVAAPTPAETGPPVPMKLLVPAYFYPSGEGSKDWNQLIEAAARVPIVAVVNPATGPGASSNHEYAEVVRRARAAGVTVIGYVNTGYAKRPRAEVEAEIDQWARFYPEIGGVFLDAQASEAEHAGYYAALRDLVRNRIKEALVVTNPGTVCAEAYVSRSTSDVVLLFENRHGFDEFSLPPWANRYPPGRFAAIPYTVPTAGRMRDALQKAVLKGIGYFYATEGDLPNPWGRLPSYWAEEVEAVVRVNERKPL